MAEPGRREVVQNPLGPNPRETAPERNVGLIGVRNPGQSGGQDAVYRENMGIASSIGRLNESVVRVMDTKKDDFLAEGKLAYMRGVTEDEIIKQGNMYTRQGWETLNAADKANVWYQNELISIGEDKATMAPEDYGKYLMGKRAEMLTDLPEDPAIRKVYVAAFEDTGTRLMADQIQKNNDFNKQKTLTGFGNYLNSTAYASASASKVVPGKGPLMVSPGVVDFPVKSNDVDRDVGIRTMLGEAGGEGTTGLAAVAHVIKNRTRDSRWGKSVSAVALEPKQFSAWNKGAGGNDPGQIDKNSPAYQQAGLIYDAVMSGHHVDPTGGATHYYSPAGMAKLVADGSQKNDMPDWLNAEAAKSGGTIKIGGHIFVGRASGDTYVPDDRASRGTEQQLDINVGALSNAGDVYKIAVGQDNTLLDAIIHYPNLMPQEKATVLADAIRRDLASGSMQMFNDAGGVSALTALGAKPADIDEVIKAKDKYDNDQDKEFSAQDELWRSDLMDAVTNGTKTYDQALVEINKRNIANSLTDSDAKQLARSVYEKYSAAQGKENKVVVPTEALNKIAQLYQGVLTGAINSAGAGDAAIKIGKEYNLPVPWINTQVSSMFSAGTQKFNDTLTAAKTAAEKKVKEDTLKETARMSIANGQGLTGVTGSITVPGSKETIPIKDWAIQDIQQRNYTKAQSAIENSVRQLGEDHRDEITTKTLNEAQLNTYRQLAKQGIVDDKFGAQVGSAVSGAILDKNGKPTDSAIQAFDFYMRAQNDPMIGPEYLSKMFGDNQYAREIMTLASTMYEGRLDLEPALIKAHALMNDPNYDPKDTLPQDAVFTNTLKTGIDKMIYDSTKDSWWNSVMGQSASVPDEMKTEVLKNSRQATTFVKNRAAQYYAQNQRLSPLVAVKMATEDLGNQSSVVGNNLIIGGRGRTLLMDMGMPNEAKSLPNKVVTDYLRQNGPAWWAQMKDGKEISNPFKAGVKGQYLAYGMQSAETAMGTMGRGGMASIFANKDVPSSVPDFYAEYDPANRLMTIRLYKDKSTGEVLPDRPMVIDVAALGQRYIDEQTAPPGSDPWNDISNGLAKAWRSIKGE